MNNPRPDPVAIDPRDGRPVFGWWEIRSERERLMSKVRSARTRLADSDLSTEAARLDAYRVALKLLDEAVVMLDVEIPSASSGDAD